MQRAHRGLTDKRTSIVRLPFSSDITLHHRHWFPDFGRQHNGFIFKDPNVEMSSWTHVLLKVRELRCLEKSGTQFLPMQLHTAFGHLTQTAAKASNLTKTLLLLVAFLFKSNVFGPR